MDEATQNSRSPREESAGEIKRKRKVLSCYDCRRRKLRCDRGYPSCTRCQKAGLADSCSYDERSLQSRHSDLGTLVSPKQDRTTTSAPLERPSSSPAPHVRHPSSHVRQINRVENRPSPLEANQTSGTWQLFSEPISSKNTQQRPVIRVDSKNKLPSPFEPMQTEMVIFRGESFKTQYYGGSNPTSIIAHVRFANLFL
jgi:Fungal Zn(2)-Cys(6) binuclear cluster domain